MTAPREKAISSSLNRGRVHTLPRLGKLRSIRMSAGYAVNEVRTEPDLLVISCMGVLTETKLNKNNDLASIVKGERDIHHV